MPLVVLLDLGLIPVFATWAWVDGGGIWWSSEYLAPAAAIVAIQVVANLLFVRALSVSPLSLTVPFLTLTSAFSALVAFVVLNEIPSGHQAAGIAAVVFGSFVLASGGADDAQAEPSPRFTIGALIREPGVPMMIGVALLWSVSVPLDKLALRYADVPAHALVQVSGTASALLVWVLARGRASELRVERRQIKVLALAVAFTALALATQLMAIQRVLIGLVETIKRAIGLVAAIVVGRLVFAERLTARKGIAVALMILGCALLV